MANKKYEALALKEAVNKAKKELEKRGIKVEFINTKEGTLKRLKELIPKNSEVMIGGSTTLEQIGFVNLLKSKNHPWVNLKDKILAEKDKNKQNELRRLSVTSQYFIGSVHAVSQTGELLVASASGSQIPSYAFSSDNVIWVVGTHKITKNLKDAFDRVRNYALPLEDKRMKSIGYSGSTIGKLLIFEREIMPNRKITLIFVNEKLGF